MSEEYICVLVTIAFIRRAQFDKGFLTSIQWWLMPGTVLLWEVSKWKLAVGRNGEKVLLFVERKVLDYYRILRVSPEQKHNHIWRATHIENCKTCKSAT